MEMKETKTAYVLVHEDGEEEKLFKREYYKINDYILHKSCVLATAFKKDTKEARKNIN
jgi:hypothetical protein